MMNDRQVPSDNDYAWLSAGSLVPLTRQKPSRHEDIVVRLLTRYWWPFIVLGLLGFLVFGYAGFENGRMDARYDRQHGIRRF